MIKPGLFTDMDVSMMERAIKLAKKAAGFVSPNPMVGAIVVKNGLIMGEGYHEKIGEAHAEVNALNAAGLEAKGADLYVTLEPCSHFGKTPPCADKVIEAGVKRVFIASRDPNPLVAGKGVNKLKEAGIEVFEDLCKEDAEKINQVFLKYIKTKVPYLFLKCAITLDGKLASSTGDSKWISNEFSREKSHKYRARFSSIMVGINTLLNDDPELTARISGAKNPKRILVDPSLKCPEDSKFVKNADDGKSIIVSSMDIKDSKKQKEFANKNITFIFFEGNRFSIKDILIELGKHNIDSVFLEGGASLISQAFKEDLIDAGEIFVSPQIMGDSKAKAFVSGFETLNISESLKLNNVKVNTYADNAGFEFINKFFSV